jgi:lysozyme family protein
LDGASVPRIFWSIVPPWGQYGQAAAVHDYLCEYLTVMTKEGPKRITRKRTDQIFEEAMQVLGVDGSKIAIMSTAVNAYRVFSGTSEPQLWKEKLLLEAAWREKHGVSGEVILDKPSTETAVISETVKVGVDEIDTPEPDSTFLRTSMREIMTRDWIIKDKVNVEAGYVNNPNDPGKATNKGITEVVARKHETALRDIYGWDGDMKTLTTEMAIYIYILDYWNVLRLDEIHAVEPMLADKLFDIGINAGVGRAASWMQNYINVCNRMGKLYPDMKVDGQLGPTTIARMNDYLRTRGEKAMPRLLKAMLCKQGAHYQDISVVNEKLEEFTYGWMARLEHNFEMYYDELWR